MSHSADDLCDCEPNSLDECEYRLLADSIEAVIDVQDGDEAEVSLIIKAVIKAAAYIAAQPCTCAYGYEHGPCPRCDALGQWHGMSRDGGEAVVITAHLRPAGGTQGDVTT